MSEIVQGSDAWKALRLGKATASRIADIIAKTKSGYSTSRTNYMAELIAERLTGNVAESYTNTAMQWGTEKEPEALTAYEFLTNAEIERVAFVDHPTIAMSGASPDGLAGRDGLVEVKCPNTATHLETLLGGIVPAKYLTQMQWQMACTGRVWCDFCSFDPRMPEEMRLFVQRVPRDGAMIARLETEVSAFLAELDEKVAALRARYLVKEAA
jgi:putative phage-type endonuclease